MKDINTLTGIEFENLCQALLQKSGFDVETTKASGDGGIDLIARNNQPFFSGKYIIQCKRYAGSVGEPIVRDLYGVVMAERANKGILLTTGHFTISAVRFASDKNLELIDGEMMGKLLHDNKLISDAGTSRLKHFTQFDCFNKQKYDFYKGMIAQNKCAIDMGRDFLFSFMFGYFLETSETANDDLFEMIHSGFSEEFLHLFDWYVDKYYKRGQDKLRKRTIYIERYKSLAQLFNLNLFEFVQDRYALLTHDPAHPKYYIKYRTDNDFSWNGDKSYNTFFMRDWNEDYYKKEKRYIIRNLKNPDRVQFDEEYIYETMNLLSLFHYFKIKSGVELINKLLFGNFPELKAWIKAQGVYINACNGLIITYNNSDDRLDDDFSFNLNLSAYFKKFKTVDKEIIANEIEKIETLLASI